MQITFQARPLFQASTFNMPLFGARKSKKAGGDSFSPSLAAEVDLSKLRFPVIISPKIDGNRAFVKNNVIMSRGVLPIKNKQVQETLGTKALEGMDGELIDGPATDPHVLSTTNKLLRSINAKSSNYTFYVFDMWNIPQMPFKDRLAELQKRAAALTGILKERVQVVPQVTVNSVAEIEAKEKEWLADGYEGVIIKNPDAEYLNKRATKTNQAYMKLKRFADAEALIVAARPLRPNGTTAKNLISKGIMTKEEIEKLNDKNQILTGYIAQDLKTGVQFTLPVQLKLDDARKAWKQRGKMVDKVVKYKHFPIGVEEKPRHAQLLGVREEHDMPTELKQLVKEARAKARQPVASDEE